MKTHKERQIERLKITAYHIKAALRALKLKQTPKQSIKLALEWLNEAL